MIRSSAALVATVGLATFATFEAFDSSTDTFTRSVLPQVETASVEVAGQP